MITGNVTERREAVILLDLRGPTGRTLRVEAVVDTGFNGSLTLWQRDIDDLMLAWQGRAEATLADGSKTTPNVYEARVMWDGRSRQIPITSAETKRLVGMKLMENYRLTIDIVSGGPLVLEKMTTP